MRDRIVLSGGLPQNKEKGFSLFYGRKRYVFSATANRYPLTYKNVDTMNSF